MVSVENLEADRAHAPANRVRRSEEPRRFEVTAGISGHVGETLKNFWNEKVTADAGGDAERFVGVAFSGLQFAIGDFDEGTRHQRPRQIDALRHRHGLVGPPAGGG